MNLEINATIEAEQDAVERCGEHFSESESPRLRDHAGPLEEVRGSASRLQGGCLFIAPACQTKGLQLVNSVTAGTASSWNQV